MEYKYNPARVHLEYIVFVFTILGLLHNVGCGSTTYRSNRYFRELSPPRLRRGTDMEEDACVHPVEAESEAGATSVGSGVIRHDLYVSSGSLKNQPARRRAL